MIGPNMKTLIALDIDGTLTSDLHALPQEVQSYLERLTQLGVIVVLITGRCFSLAYPPLANWKFPFLLAVHNGAVILQMPEKKIISEQYIDPTVIGALEEIVNDEETDFSLYTSIKNEDICYYRPLRYSSKLREYVDMRSKLCRENWVAVENYATLPLSSLAAIKFFGDKESSHRIKLQVENKLSLHIPVIRDPIDQRVYIAQATHPDIDKGTAVDRILNGEERFVIAAGDDLNDLPMLTRANLKIVMGTAPEELKRVADVVAKPAEELGIIEALENARHHWI